jgi:hypothetical protein
LLYWYGRLQALEASDTNSSGKHLTEVQIELQRIDEAVSRIHFPLAFSDQVYNLRSYIEIVRQKRTCIPQKIMSALSVRWGKRITTR